MKLNKWKKTTLKNYISKHSPTKEEVDHILEFLKNHPDEKLQRASYPQIKAKAQRWIEIINNKSKTLKDSGKVEKLLSFKDGSYLAHLIDDVSKKWEGKHMGHCVGSYTTHSGIYSIRDSEDIPHCTFEIYQNHLTQIQGRANGPVAPRYIDLVLKSLDHFNYPINSGLIHRLGYADVNIKVAAFLKKFSSGAKIIKVAQQNYLYRNCAIKIKNNFKSNDVEVFQFCVDQKFPHEVLINFIKSGVPNNQKTIGDVTKTMNHFGYFEKRKKICNFLNEYFKGVQIFPFHKKTFIKKSKKIKLIKPFKSKDTDMLIDLLDIFHCPEAVALFIKNGLDAKENSSVAFRLSAKHGCLESVKYLVEAGARISDIDYMGVKMACLDGHLPVVKYLCSKINMTDYLIGDLLSYAAYNSHEEVINFLILQAKKPKETLLNAIELCIVGPTPADGNYSNPSHVFQGQPILIEKLRDI